MTSRFYRLHDHEPALKAKGAIATQVGELEHWNAQGWGVFHTVNLFDGARRKANLRAIKSWTVEVDAGPSEFAARAAQLHASPLIPSLVVESKNGWHVYWHAKPGATVRAHRPIQTALCNWFGGDMKARDLARILRTPGFLHQKDPAHPFRIREVHRLDVAYTEAQMLDAFGVVLEDEKPNPPATRPSPAQFPNEGNFWQRAIDLDCRWALEQLSGHWLVGGETIELKPSSNGKFAIWCNGKSTSCWVDADGKIGSADHGGPSIVRWCAWYGNSWRDIARGLKEVFPELDDKQARRAA